MSKLNDSTLKILKKYRLDTDMSVFGNENKLYDVVKVMDDMVGGQVSKYKAYVRYASSIYTNKGYLTTVQDSSVFKTISENVSISSPNILIIVDAKSYKVLSVAEKPNVICFGYLQGITKLLGYVCYDIENKTYGVYSDISGTNSLTGTKCDEDFGFIPFVIFSSDRLQTTSSDHLVCGLVSGSSANSNSFTYSYITTGDITLPEEVVSLIPSGYYGCPTGAYYLGFNCYDPYTATEVEYDL